MSEESTGAISGAAQGAAVGTMIMPGIGTAVGAVVGAIGGFFSGSKARAARLSATKATKLERQVSYMDAGKKRVEYVRQQRIEEARARAAIAFESGGLESSAGRGALSSSRSQYTSNLGYFDWRINQYSAMQFYMDKAGKYAAQSQQINGMMQSLFQAAQLFAPSPGSTPSPGGGGGTPQVGTSYQPYSSLNPGGASLLGGSAPSNFGTLPGGLGQ